MGIILILITMYSVSCVNTNRVKSGYGVYLDSLKGETKDSMIVKWGVPTEQIELSDGKTAFMWETIDNVGDSIMQCKETLVFDVNDKVVNVQSVGCDGGVILDDGWPSKHFREDGGLSKWKDICKGGKPCY